MAIFWERAVHSTIRTDKGILMCLLGIDGCPGVSLGVLMCLGVSWGNKTDRVCSLCIMSICNYTPPPANCVCGRVYCFHVVRPSDVLFP